MSHAFIFFRFLEIYLQNMLLNSTKYHKSTFERSIFMKAVDNTTTKICVYINHFTNTSSFTVIAILPYLNYKSTKTLIKEFKSG